MAHASLIDYMRATVGPKWVIARRTPRTVRQYGEDVICLSPAKYAKLQAAFDAQAPSVENAARATLRALKQACQCIVYCRRNHQDVQAGTGFPVELHWQEIIKQAEAAGIK